MSAEQACATEARSQFSRYYQPPRLFAPDAFWSATEHYNTGLRKCFVLLVTVGLVPRYARREELKDVFSGASYGVYSEIRDMHDAQDRTRVSHCGQTPVGKPAKVCTIEAEWRGYLVEYMGRSGP